MIPSKRIVGVEEGGKCPNIYGVGRLTKKPAKPATKGATKNIPPVGANPAPIADVAPPARVRRRHRVLFLSFLLFVLAPAGIAIYYMYEIAEDQYSSRVSFSIRSEEFTNPLDAFSSLGQISTGSSPDASILNEYIRSQIMLEEISDKIDLRAIYSKPENDPLFTFDPNGSIEDLLRYWQWMTYVSYDAGTGLIDIEVFAFTAHDAHLIATQIMQTSNALVDKLSHISRKDTTKDALFELDRANERLSQAHQKLGDFRDARQTIDPLADLESRMGVLTALQQQLASAIIEHDLLAETTSLADPRLENMIRRVDAIQARIDQERSKIGQTSDGEGSALASVVGQYERLLADREFAATAYLAAAANYDLALAEARRKSRYLAAHIPPTMAQTPQYPQRLLIVLSVFGGALLFWMISVLTVYAMLDRR
jgi:capsular polysaccharide transport system permease protein